MKENIILLTPHGGKPGILSSRLGGVPYWDDTKEYPRSPVTGEPMAMLVQIDLDSIDDERLPDHGILQLFVDLSNKEKIYGTDLQMGRDGYRVVYHEDPVRTTRKKILELGAFDGDFEKYGDRSPANHFLKKPRFMEGKKEIVLKAKKKKQRVPRPGTDDLPDFNAETRMFGSPAFLQEDPRETDPELAKYDTLLLELTSNGFYLFGDDGKLYVLISHEALERKDFSDVLVCFDCD